MVGFAEIVVKTVVGVEEIVVDDGKTVVDLKKLWSVLGSCGRLAKF